MNCYTNGKVSMCMSICTYVPYVGNSNMNQASWCWTLHYPHTHRGTNPSKSFGGWEWWCSILVFTILIILVLITCSCSWRWRWCQKPSSSPEAGRRCRSQLRQWIAIHSPGMPGHLIISRIRSLVWKLSKDYPAPSLHLRYVCHHRTGHISSPFAHWLLTSFFLLSLPYITTRRIPCLPWSGTSGGLGRRFEKETSWSVRHTQTHRSVIIRLHVYSRGETWWFVRVYVLPLLLFRCWCCLPTYRTCSRCDTSGWQRHPSSPSLWTRLSSRKSIDFMPRLPSFLLDSTTSVHLSVCIHGLCCVSLSVCGPGPPAQTPTIMMRTNHLYFQFSFLLHVCVCMYVRTYKMGLKTGIPTIGCAKTFLHVDGLDTLQVRKALNVIMTTEGVFLEHKQTKQQHEASATEAADGAIVLPLEGDSKRVSTLSPSFIFPLSSLLIQSLVYLFVCLGTSFFSSLLSVHGPSIDVSVSLAH